MTYIPEKEILEKYAKLLIDFALWGGEGINKGETVLIQVPECAKPMLIPLQQAVLQSGGHPIMKLIPDGAQKNFFDHANNEQLTYMPEEMLNSEVQVSDHRVRILADHKKGELSSIDPKKIINRSNAYKPFKRKLFDKETQGKLSRTLALYGTQAMAKEVGMTQKEYREQIIQACYLDTPDPIQERKKMFISLDKIKKRLSDMPIEYLHVQGEDADLKVQLGTNRQWLAGSGRNIPSFEVYVSPDRRGTQGRIRFNQPLYRYGNIIKGIELHFEKGLITKATAQENEKLLKEMIAAPNANKIGEYSLTDKRISRITKFMAETLYDENVGGPYGNTHLAVGMAYKDSYKGDIKNTTKEQWEEMGFNDSPEHTDIMSTTDRTVTAYLQDGTSQIIYKDGMFQIDIE